MPRLTRREFLGAGAAAATLGFGVGPPSAMAQDFEWSNWSGSVRCRPRSMLRAASVDEVVAAIRSARGPVRAVGSGHSFVPLCATDETILVLSRLRGIESIDTEAGEATILGGTKLYQIGPPLAAAGLAMETLPDIDRQALAGAIATGTHGTGPTIGSLSTQVVAMEIATADGDLVHCSESNRPELLRAARVSLGALGVVTRVRLRLLPAYRLHERAWVASFEECLEDLAANIAANRHFEFFWAPGRDACLMKSLNPTDEAEDRESDDGDFGGERVGPAHEIFASERNTLFNEIEFSIPADRGPDCLVELRALMQTRHPDVSWPLEYRTVAADSSCLSTAHDRPTVTISAHQAAELGHEAFFADVEAVFRNHQGRPHWGKMHHLEAEDLEPLYPAWGEFQKVREELDPQGRFLNPYLRRLLG